MSTSKGTGATAHAMAETLPPELLRFLFLRHKPRKAIEFDPEGDAIPGLFDEFDRIAGAVAGREVRGELPPDPERIFRASLVTEPDDLVAEAARFRPAFRHLALLVQVPGVDLDARIEAEKGAPLDAGERAILDQRVAVARSWLAEFAPTATEWRSETMACRPRRLQLDPQRAYLAALAAAVVDERPTAGDAWQDLIFRTAQARELPSAQAFGAIYLAFLGRPNGPRAGWLLASLEPGFVEERLRAAAVQVGSATPVGRAIGGGRRMSVGLQRLREDAARLRGGAVEKGEDPAVVDFGCRARRPPPRAAGRWLRHRCRPRTLGDLVETIGRAAAGGRRARFSTGRPHPAGTVGHGRAALWILAVSVVSSAPRFPVAGSATSVVRAGGHDRRRARRDAPSPHPSRSCWALAPGRGDLAPARRRRIAGAWVAYESTKQAVERHESPSPARATASAARRSGADGGRIEDRR